MKILTSPKLLTEIIQIRDPEIISEEPQRLATESPRC